MSPWPTVELGRERVTSSWSLYLESLGLRDCNRNSEETDFCKGKQRKNSSSSLAHLSANSGAQYLDRAGSCYPTTSTIFSFHLSAPLSSKFILDRLVEGRLRITWTWVIHAHEKQELFIVVQETT